MELLNALLAGFFLWLLLFHAQYKAIGRMRREAGELVLRVNAVPGLPRKRWPLMAGIFLLVCLVVNIGIIVAVRRTPPLAMEFSYAVQLWVALTLVVPVGPASIVLEVRQHGVLHNMWARRRFWPGWLSYTPWYAIDDCTWVPSRPLLTGRPRLSLSEEAISPEQRAAVTAALGRFVPVYDSRLTLLAQPEKTADAGSTAPTGRTFRRRPFQFDLQSLLILTVVVACAANCYGIHSRDPRPRQNAMAKLATFGPRIVYRGKGVAELDFSNCPTKPGDDDLACLEPFVELESLKLTGAPVTDAGMWRLKGLKGLRRLDLIGTDVTGEGLWKLMWALPDVSVTYGPFYAPSSISRR